MITQYAQNNSSPNSDMQSIVANRVGLVDSYILMQTNDQEYTALIYNNATKDCNKLVFSRSSSNYNTQYTVVESDGVWEFNVTNEYYVYSNTGIGKSLTLPVYQGVISYSLVAITCVLTFAILFKGVLFKWLKK